MTKVVSIVPAQSNSDGCHRANGTRVLLSDGSELKGVAKVTLVAEVGELWKAIIEVHPTNQQQINALLQDASFEVTDPDGYQYEV